MMDVIVNPEDLHAQIASAVPRFLRMVRDRSRTAISDRCLFITSEIRNSTENSYRHRERVTKENAEKIPCPLEEATAVLQQRFQELYDINLCIHRSARNLTIIDIRYYLKSSLDSRYLEVAHDNAPMLHCIVTIPWWLNDKSEKFDINWERKRWLILWKLFLQRLAA